MNPNEAHEHPAPFHESPIVNPRVFATTREALARAFRGTSKHAAYQQILSDIKGRVQTLDWLAERARRMVLGDVEARRLFRAWMQANLDTSSQSTGHESPQPASQPSMTGSDTATRALTLAPVVDIFMGATYEANGNEDRLAQQIGSVRAVVLGTAPVLDLLYGAAAFYLDDGETLDTLTVALEEFIKGVDLSRDAGRPAAADLGPLPVRRNSPTRNLRPFLRGLDALTEEWKRENPVSLWITHTGEREINSRLIAVFPGKVRAGDELTLHADVRKPFPVPLPRAVVVGVGHHGVHAEIKRWEPTEVVVDVPDEATSGYVYFRRTLTRRTQQHMEDSLQRFANLLPDDWPETFLAIHAPTAYVPPPHALPDDRNAVQITHRPRIVSFQAFTANGSLIQKEPVEAGASVTLRWSVTSDEEPAPEVRIRDGGRSAWSRLPLTGALGVVLHRRASFVLDVIVGDLPADSSSIEVDTSLFLRMYPEATGLAPGQTASLWIEIADARDENLEITLTSSDPAKVVVWPRVTLFAGRRTAVTVVTGVEPADEPGRPAARITATAPGYFESWVFVWIENPIGQWSPPDSIFLDLVAIHAALLPNGRVLFFSHDENEPTNLNRGKYQVWNPETGGSSPLGITSRNLFCAGHCYLGDGRLLVAGGKNGGAYYPHPHDSTLPVVHEGPDRDIHTISVDPNNPDGVIWQRHRDMPQARWYPTCVTLRDGVALVVGGTRAGTRPGYPNMTAELCSGFTFADGSTLFFMSEPIPFGKNVNTYPFLQVMPDGSRGGLIFAYTGKKAWVSSSTIGSWVDETFNTHSGKLRTYDKQGSCVLLPLLPPYSQPPRLLVVGGVGWTFLGTGGYFEGTDIAEVFELDRANPENSVWRSPLGGRMLHKRFMSDSVLLPDGNVLVVNGAGRGVADGSHESVKTPELFDPATESWRAMADQSHPRHYHSVALLVPDGRVLVSGNTRLWNPGNDVDDKTIELFSPPYLFRGPQPFIYSVFPERLEYGHDFDVVTFYAGFPDVIQTADGHTIPNPRFLESVALIRVSSVTHSNNMDQRFVGLEIVGRTHDTLRVRAPLDGTVAPPGHYMLFIVSRNRVPSKGKILWVGPRQAAGASAQTAMAAVSEPTA
jgi:Domain of unknown function (DUF1929)